MNTAFSSASTAPSVIRPSWDLFSPRRSAGSRSSAPVLKRRIGSVGVAGWDARRFPGQERDEEGMEAGSGAERERLVRALRWLPAVYVLLGVWLAADAGVGPWNLSFWGVVVPLVAAVELGLWYWRVAD